MNALRRLEKKYGFSDGLLQFQSILEMRIENIVGTSILVSSCYFLPHRRVLTIFASWKNLKQKKQFVLDQAKHILYIFVLFCSTVVEKNKVHFFGKNATSGAKQQLKIKHSSFCISG